MSGAAGGLEAELDDLSGAGGVGVAVELGVGAVEGLGVVGREGDGDFVGLAAVAHVERGLKQHVGFEESFGG